MSRRLLLAFAVVVASCSPAVFLGTDGGSDAAADGGADVASPDAFNPSDAGEAACPYLGAGPTCSGQMCTVTQSCCVASAPPQCVLSTVTCAGASLQCLSATDCMATGTAVCCLMNGDAGEPLTQCPRKFGAEAHSACVVSSNCVAVGDVHVCVTNNDCPAISPRCVTAEISGTTFTLGVCSP